MQLHIFISTGILLVGSVSAGPACAARNYKTTECISACKARFGWPGMGMGTDRWGSVMKPAGASASMDDIVSSACGMATSNTNTPVPSSTATVPQAVGSDPTAVSAPQVVSTTAVVLPSAVASSAVESSISLASLASPSTASSTTIAHTTSSTTTHLATTSTKPAPQTTSTAPKTTPTTVAEVKTAPPYVPKATTTSTKAPQTTSTSSSSSDSSGSSSSDSGSTSASDIQAYLSSHNTVRAQHGAVTLTWNDNLADAALKWANGCVFQHSGGTLGPFGENLAAGTGDFTIQQGIQLWANEVSQYNPSDPVASHFTQMVWKASTELGCAKVTCPELSVANFQNAVYIVCEYSPQGNVEGEFGANVQV